MTVSNRTARIRANQGSHAVNRLWAHMMAAEIIPCVGGLADVIGALSQADRIKAAAKSAADRTKAAIQSVRDAADPNPFRMATDEEIALEILRQVEDRKAAR